MKNSLFIVLAALMAMTLVSCGQAPSGPDFAKKATRVSLYQVDAGKIAVEKAQSEAVKQFARDMVEAYGKIGDEIKGIVQGENLPGKPHERQEKWIGALNEAAPEKFDKTYARLELRSLERAAELFDRYAEEGENAKLKKFAADTLGLITQHLERAKKLP